MASRSGTNGADNTGDLGPCTASNGGAWLAPDGSTIDQIALALQMVRNNPDSRRIMVSAWNVAELPRMALQPCHVLFQLYVAEGACPARCIREARTSFSACPFNIASYALLTHMFAQQCDLEPGNSFGPAATVICIRIISIRSKSSSRAHPIRCLSLCCGGGQRRYLTTSTRILNS